MQIKKIVWWIVFLLLFVPFCCMFLLYAATCCSDRMGGFIDQVFRRLRPFDSWAGMNSDVF